MPGTPPPASGERQSLIEFLRFNQDAFFSAAYGLTDEQVIDLYRERIIVLGEREHNEHMQELSLLRG